MRKCQGCNKMKKDTEVYKSVFGGLVHACKECVNFPPVFWGKLTLCDRNTGEAKFIINVDAQTRKPI
jgi:hypothetical protein